MAHRPGKKLKLWRDAARACLHQGWTAPRARWKRFGRLTAAHAHAEMVECCFRGREWPPFVDAHPKMVDASTHGQGGECPALWIEKDAAAGAGTNLIGAEDVGRLKVRSTLERQRVEFELPLVCGSDQLLFIVGGHRHPHGDKSERPSSAIETTGVMVSSLRLCHRHRSQDVVGLPPVALRRGDELAIPNAPVCWQRNLGERIVDVGDRSDLARQVAEANA